MRYLLDTNICIYLINGDNSLKEKVKEIGVYSLGISNATLAELYFGAYNSEFTNDNLRNVADFKKNLTAYSDSNESAELFGKIKSELKRSGNIIEDFDILIASIAMANDCVLVTNNPRHFERIEKLHTENWI